MNQRAHLIKQIQLEFPKLDGFLAGLLADLWIENKSVETLLEDDDCDQVEEHIPFAAESGGEERVPSAI